jgi:predicted amidohydrolase YtcJ
MLCFAACGPIGQKDADWVLTGGKIFTVDDRNPWAEAVAVKDGKFIYVGDDAGAAKFVSDATRKSDLGGRLVIPGIVDSHTHPGLIALDPYEAPLPETSKEDILAAVKEYAESNPELEWVRMCCWPVSLYGNGKVGPNKDDLDKIVPDRPVWLSSDTGHSIWVNSKALEVLGVDRNTPDPRPGLAFYVRDEDGEPNGWIKEGAFWGYGKDHFEVDVESHEKGMTDFVNYLSRHGVTTVYDGGNVVHADRVYAFMAKLDREGRLPLRYEGTYDIYVPGRRDAAVAELRRLDSAYGGNRLHFNTIKLFMDGSNESRTGAVLEPYADDPENSGNTMVTTDELRDLLLELNEEKLDLHVHCVADRAVRTVLDAVEAARDSVGGELYPRVTVCHLDIIDPADYSRIKELGVVTNYTPWWHGFNDDDPVLHALGEERYARTLLLKPLFDIGAVVTFSSDEWWGLEYISPFLGMQIGHNRQYLKEWEESMDYNAETIRGPESERLDLELMIRGYTINGAHQLRMEDRIGSIETGKLADLVVLDEDLFEMDRYEIHKIEPSAVMMEGELLHGALP